MTLDNNIFNDVFLFSPFNSVSSNVLTPVSKMLVSLDGIQSCVPTRTTATLTPTTMRNIEQTYMELNDFDVTKSGQAGFVPPLPSFPEQDYSTGLSSIESGSNGSWNTPPPVSDEIVSNLQQSSETKRGHRSDSRKNMGGRRPNKPSNLSAEEEEKRRVRRERNKLAAARCRKRRVDQTNELLMKVDELEREKSRLRSEMKNLRELKDELEFQLNAHVTSPQCIAGNSNRESEVKPLINTFGELTKIKEEPIELDGPPSPKRVMLSSSTLDITPGVIPSLDTPTLPTMKRPNSLNLDLKITSSQSRGRSIADLAGIQVTTPSSGFNYFSLMNGGTGLTPVAAPLQPTINSPMLRNGSMDLQTPTSEPSKLVSL